MSPLVLYLRSRGVGAALAGGAASVAVLAALCALLDDSTAARVCGQLAVAAVVAAAGPGLAGADVELDRTSALDWRWRRGTHLALVTVAALGLVAAAESLAVSLGQFTEIARNSVGATGLLALGATTLGAGRAWILPVAWIGSAPRLVVHLAPHLPLPLAQVVTWPVQPDDGGLALATASTVGVIGTLLYVVRGSRSRG